MNDQMIEEIARGYAVANLWTAGVDEMSGEYVPDDGKVAALMPYAREAAQAFVHIVQPYVIHTSGLEGSRIGACLHFEREGHGTGFQDEGHGWELDRFQQVAQMMGEDAQMQDQLMDRFPSEAFAG